MLKKPRQKHTWVQVAFPFINTLTCNGLLAQLHTELTIPDKNDKGLIPIIFYIKHVLPVPVAARSKA